MPPYMVIKKRADFLSANRGRRFAFPGFILLVHDRNDGDQTVRLGITITKKVGNAVVRNRIRRRFRELMRENLPEGGRPGADHVMIGREAALDMAYSELRSHVKRALEKAADDNDPGSRRPGGGHRGSRRKQPNSGKREEAGQ